MIFSHFLCLFCTFFVQFLEKQGPDFGKDFQTKRDFFQNYFFKMAQFLLEIFSWEKLRGIDSEFRGLSIPHTFSKFYRARALPPTIVPIYHTIDFKSPSQPQAMRRKENASLSGNFRKVMAAPPQGTGCGAAGPEREAHKRQTRRGPTITVPTPK